MSIPTSPRPLPNVLVDGILALLPVRVAVILATRARWRTVNGTCPRSSSRLPAAASSSKPAFLPSGLSMSLPPAKLGLTRFRFLLSLGHDGIATATDISIAAKRNEVSLVRLLHAYGLAIVGEGPAVKACERPDFLLGDTAAANGHRSVVKLLHESALANMFSTRAMDAAATGSLEVVLFLHESSSEGCTTETMDKAARSGRLDILGCTANAMDDAVEESGGMLKPERHGRSRDVRAAGDRPLPSRIPLRGLYHQCDDEAVESWAAYGDSEDGQRFKEVVLFLHENRSEGCTRRTMDYASLLGRLDVVQFLHENRPEGCSTRAMDGECRMWENFANKAGWATGPEKADLEKNVEQAKEVVFFLHRHRTEDCTAEAMQVACEEGCVELARFLLAINPWTMAKRKSCGPCTKRASDFLIRTPK
ncbi:hypothetical protein BDK51DRAFT_37045 [Blyttiomyces helicus]|uniref:Ankyrin repeat-containing domain protein n=1 Tax=Blyttiomyces helicus TaxID=388810 RepID=A0A4P9VY21_9FUNG|nr:hypothetical protein BDK51DRAFT_37045 [Blyttiomyces helicus]|eukprot:RKO84649.1 hypothetical protein BDK51DRAFT_37045 [Blyttiomyces helicus]